MHAQVVAAAGSGVVSMVVGADGGLYSSGSSKRGQLGLGPGVTSAASPQRLPGIEGVTGVSCGWGHALALTGQQQPTNHSAPVQVCLTYLTHCGPLPKQCRLDVYCQCAHLLDVLFAASAQCLFGKMWCMSFDVICRRWRSVFLGLPS